MNHRSKLSRQYLKSNSTSHVSPLSAIAELADNAVDAGACNLEIRGEEVGGKKVLVIRDDGCGMSMQKLEKCLSFGFTVSSGLVKKEDRIGQYGNGFKSSFRRIGKNVLVLSKEKDDPKVHMGMLSESYLEKNNIEELCYLKCNNFFARSKERTTMLKNSFTSDLNYFQNMMPSGWQPIHGLQFF